MCTHMHSDGVLWTLGLFSDFFPVSVIFSSKATHTVNCCFLFVLFLTVHFVIFFSSVKPSRRLVFCCCLQKRFLFSVFVVFKQGTIYKARVNTHQKQDETKDMPVERL